MRHGLACTALLTVMSFVPLISNAATSAGNGSIGGLAQISSSDEVDSYSVLLSGSYFITDAFETGLSLSYNESDAGGGGEEVGAQGGDIFDSSQTFVLISPTVQYNFLTESDLVPFVGASYDFTGAGDFDDTDFYSLFTGIRFFMAETAAVRAEYRYRDAVDGGTISEIHLFQVGVEWFF